MGKKNAKLELIGAMLEDIISIADNKKTSGTVALDLVIIKVNSRCALNALNEFKENYEII